MNFSSSINLSPPTPPPPPPRGFPPPYNCLHHFTPPPLPALLDLAESNARPLPRKPKYKPSNGFFPHGGDPPFHYSPGLISFPPSSSSPKPRPRRKPDPAAAAAKTTSACSECSKRFSSWKALFGHMRCHPERQWLGINPTPHLRRPPPTEHFTDEEYEVASSLIVLSCGPPRESSTPCRTETDGVGAVRSLSSSQQRLTSGSRNERGSLVHGGWKRSCDGREATRCDRKYNAYSKGFSTGKAHVRHKRCHWERGGR